MMIKNQKVDWSAVDHVLLDMDGTLLDKYYDDFFWEAYLPQQYALSKGIPLEEAQQTIFAQYKAQIGKLLWTDIDHWSRQLGLDIPALKEAVADRVAVHEGVFPFLEFVKQAHKKTAILTNAHPKAIAIKLKRVPLKPYFLEIVSANDVGWPKEHPSFWEGVAKRLSFDKTRSLFVDDNEEALIAASRFGIRHLLYKSYASSRIAREDSRQFVSIRNFSEITPFSSLTSAPVAREKGSGDHPLNRNS